MPSPAFRTQKRQPALLLAKSYRCLWWQVATAPPVPPPVQRQQPEIGTTQSSTWEGPVELVVKMHKVHKHVVSHQGLWEKYKHNSSLEHISEESSEMNNTGTVKNCNPFLQQTASTHTCTGAIQTARLTGGLLTSGNQTCGLSERLLSQQHSIFSGPKELSGFRVQLNKVPAIRFICSCARAGTAFAAHHPQSSKAEIHLISCIQNIRISTQSQTNGPHGPINWSVAC